MTKLRPGDTVTFKARVVRVADYGDDQQITAKILPNGDQIGWCLPKENAFEPDTLTLNVGDMVDLLDRPGHKEKWEVKAIFDNNQIAVQKRGNWPVEIADAKQARRL